MIDIVDAIEVVLELARENIISPMDAEDNELEEHRSIAIEACDTLEGFAFNVLSK